MAQRKISGGTSNGGGVDLWQLASEESKRLVEDNGANAAKIDDASINEQDTVVLIVGDQGAGKSSLIQGFLKPNASNKDPKPTVALEYNFARKKAAGKGSGEKVVAHIWELGGDNLFDPKLLELPLSPKMIRSSAIVLCVDLSRPAQLILTSTLWLNNITKIVSKKLGKESTSLNNVFQGHRDANIVKPLDLPCYIFANKYDVYKSMQQADKRLLLQILRFIAHYYGATLIATSSVEPSMKEGFRNVLSAINFRSELRTACDCSIEKPFHITAGHDSFADILLGSERDMSAKSRLAQSEADISLYLNSSGLTKDCWGRLSDHLKSAFGDAVVPSSDRDEDQPADNEYPETDVDAMRAERDLILERYILEKERKEATLNKMNASGDDGNEIVEDRNDARAAFDSRTRTRK